MFQLKSVVPLATAALRSVKATGRKLAVGALALLAVAGLTVSGASVASADPIGSPMPRDINLVGSDTLQDVDNGIANVTTTLVGANPVKYIGSWDAKSPTWTGAGIAPNGSTEGLEALSAALQGKKWKNPLDVQIDVVDKVQAARSSSSPKALNSNGPLQFIPLGRDAVTYATAGTTNVPSGIPLTATGTELSLKAIFSCAPGVFTHGGKSYHTDDVVRTGVTKLEPQRLQTGSGTRSFWEGSSVTGAPGACVTGAAQEHRGEVLVGEVLVGKPNALVPFSISQWIAQENAGATNQNDTAGSIAGTPVKDRRFGAKLMSVGAASPFDITGTKQNPSFNSTLTRDVYNVISADAVLNPGASTANRLLNEAFVGVDSDSVTATFNETLVIELFGFSKTLKNTALAPGQISLTLRANYYDQL